jgi:hypothetical protein
MVDYVLDRKVRVDFGPVDGKQANARASLHLDWLDCALICLFLGGAVSRRRGGRAAPATGARARNAPSPRGDDIARTAFPAEGHALQSRRVAA